MELDGFPIFISRLEHIRGLKRKLEGSRDKIVIFPLKINLWHFYPCSIRFQNPHNWIVQKHEIILQASSDYQQLVSLTHAPNHTNQ